ncbi:MAG: TRAP transporter large permease subunit [Nitriliruptorales bacterium]|nr:TRAP transporter large permease subunit [Nitriliruptorales bacterium]
MITAVLCLLLLFALISLGLPVFLSVASAVVVFLIASDGWPLTFPQQMIAGMSNFILLALPLFIFAGGLMNAADISGRIFRFARALVGFLPGGLGHVNVVTSMFFGGLIGTSVADLAGTGSIVIPAMKDDGYPADFACALTASSSGIGPMIPPSSPMILYAAVTGTSLGALFLAGVIPGVLLGLSQMAIVAVLARRRGWKAFAPFSLREIGRSARTAMLAFGMPVIIVGGLVFGIFTPTEAGAFAAVYGMVIALVVYRSLNLVDLYRVAVRSVTLTGEVMFIVGVSVSLGRALAGARVPQALAEAIDRVVIGDSVHMRLFAIIILAIIAGMVLDPLIPIVVPIVLPTVLLFGIDPIHFGIIMVTTVVIGQVTPPLAMTLVVGAKIGRVDVFDALKANTPFLLGMIVFLIVLVFVPEIATWLPSVLMN